MTKRLDDKLPTMAGRICRRLGDAAAQRAAQAQRDVEVMADPRFFTVAGPFTVAEIAARTGAEIAGAGDGGRLLRDVAPLDAAGPEHLSLPRQSSNISRRFRTTRAGAAFVHPDRCAATRPSGVTLLVTPAALSRLCASRRRLSIPSRRRAPAIAPGAAIDPTRTAWRRLRASSPMP